MIWDAGGKGLSTTGRRGRRSTGADAAGFAERWERATVAGVAELEGDWAVERLTGPVPMPFVWKRVRGGRGRTRLLPRPPSGATVEPGLPFVLRDRGGHVELRYGGPFSPLHDELRLERDGGWLGKAYLARVRYAWFRMAPVVEGGAKTRAVRLR